MLLSCKRSEHAAFNPQSPDCLVLPAVSPGFTKGQALLGEMVMTCFLCYVGEWMQL